MTPRPRRGRSRARCGSGSSVLKREGLAPEWQADAPVLCVAGRGPLDEAAAAMLAQLLQKRAGRARRGRGRRRHDEYPAPRDVGRRDGVPILSRHGQSRSYALHHPSHAPQLPTAQIMLGCWKADADTAALRDSTNPRRSRPRCARRSSSAWRRREFRLPAGCATARGERPRHRVPPLGAGLGRRRLPGISYRSHRFVGPMMTPTMLCSTGVHSMPNPGVG